MAINLHCSNCKSSSNLRKRYCRSCGYDFSNGKKYRVVVNAHDGRRVSKVVESIAYARKLEGKLKTQAIEKNLFGINQIPLIDDVWLKYLSWAKENKKSWQDDLHRWDKHIYPYIRGKRMDSISAYDVQNILKEMRSKRPYAPATIKHIIVLIRRVYNWAYEMDLYEGSNPASKIKPPKLNNEVTECLTQDEIHRLMKILDTWVNQRAALLVKFALYTGFRRGEVFALKWEDVDLENGMITLKETKGGKDTNLPISDKALSVLRKAKGLLPTPDCPFVFPSRTGNKRTTIGKTWTRIKKAATTPSNFRFHGLRHTFASYLASSGKVSQYTLQKLLTHKTPQMTQRYAHLFDETLREGANQFSAMI